MSLADEDPLFTSLCSSRTLQSDDKGFFYTFYQAVEERFPTKTWLKDVYSALPNDREKLRVLYEDPDICGTVLGTLEHVRPVFRAKDAKFSLHKREEAYSLMKQGKLPQALLISSQAIVRAPKKNENMTVDNGLSLAFAFWIRAEIFIEMLDGEKALRDLKLAAKYGVPASQNPKYYARLCKCYKLLGDEKKLDVTFNLFRKLNTGGSYDEKILVDELSEIETKKAKGKPEFLEETAFKKPVLLGKENEAHPGASDHLDVQESGSKQGGRFFAAKKDIPAGKTILTEKSFAACLYSKNFGSFCTECFGRLVAPVPCETCSGLAFCSVECRDAASAYHKFECEFLNLMIGSGMSILCFIALRIVAYKNLEVGTARAKAILAQLCEHSELRPSEDHFQRALMVSFLLRILQKGGFFGRRTTEAAEPTSQELEVGVLLLGLLQALQFNAHEIYGTKIVPPHRIEGSKVQGLGIGIFRTASLFNHSCVPAVTRYFQGTSIVLATALPLAPGEMVSENYGPMFNQVALKDRQRSLRSRYWFKCECKACVENWPLAKDLTNFSRIRCTTSKCQHFLKYPKDPTKPVKCPMCKSQVILQTHVELLKKCEFLYSEAAEFMAANKIEEAIDRFQVGLNLFGKVSTPPHKDTHVAISSLRTCLATFGNTFVL